MIILLTVKITIGLIQIRMFIYIEIRIIISTSSLNIFIVGFITPLRWGPIYLFCWFNESTRDDFHIVLPGDVERAIALIHGVVFPVGDLGDRLWT